MYLVTAFAGTLEDKRFITYQFIYNVISKKTLGTDTCNYLQLNSEQSGTASLSPKVRREVRTGFSNRYP